MIKSFADTETERLFQGLRPRRLPKEVWRRAGRKWLILNAAISLDELRAPPVNRLEKLRHGREDRHSIRINDPWRICFSWVNGDAYLVEIVDYHG